MALIDCHFWLTRRKLSGACGSFIIPRWIEISGSDDFTPYVRMRPSTLRKDSRLTNARKVAWGHLHTAWLTVLDDEDRSDWNDFAAEFAYRDQNQQLRPWFGIQAFCHYGARAILAGFDPVTNPGDLGISDPFNTLSVAILDDTTVRVTFSPNPESYQCVMLYGRGPTSAGVTAIVPPVVYGSNATPHGFRFIGASALDAESPLDFTWPVAIPSAKRVTITGCLMDYSGVTPDDWLTATVVRT